MIDFLKELDEKSARALTDIAQLIRPYRMAAERYTSCQEASRIDELASEIEDSRQYLSVVDNEIMISRRMREICDEIDEQMDIEEHADDAIKTLDIDIETYSSADISCGVYKYAEAEDFEVLLFSFAKNGGPAQIVDMANGEQLTDDIVAALTDDEVIKVAHNATFERVCLSRWLRDRGLICGFLSPKSWRCTMVMAARAGLPMTLKGVGEVLGLEKQKMGEGAELIRLFCVPQKITKKKTSARVLASDEPEKWEIFKRYCKRDVEVEKAIYHKLKWVDEMQPSWEKKLYCIDAEINDRGVLVDLALARKASEMAEEIKTSKAEEVRRLTGIDNVKSTKKVKEWIEDETGQKIDSLNRKSIGVVRESIEGFDVVNKLLDLRKEANKTSLAKYDAMLKCACVDGRVRGMTQFYGAARTGRWAGRLVQLQNLPKNKISDLELARGIVLNGTLDELTDNYDDASDVLSQLVRTAFVPSAGKMYYVCDFSAIEARVIAWLAGEGWVIEAFQNGQDIYCETASKMFGVKVEKHGEHSDLRAKGKIAVLALGYEGGVGSLMAMGADKMGMSDDEMRDTVRMWRDANPHIVRMWRLAQNAAIQAIEDKQAAYIVRNAYYEYKRGCLILHLPSGRSIIYPRASVEIEQLPYKTTKIITYEGRNQMTKKWEKIKAYGGKLVENLVQATARDILAEVFLRAEKSGKKIVFHVHDEIITEISDKAEGDEINEFFSRPIKWAQGLPIKGEGYITEFYKKD